MIFRVLVNGEDFNARIDGESRNVGFYVTRIVTADDQQKAGAIAEESVKRDLPANVSASGQSRVASIEIEEGDDADSELQFGYSFYLMEDQSS
jgi:hypothetical protein